MQLLEGPFPKDECSKNIQAAIGPPAMCAAMCASLQLDSSIIAQKPPSDEGGLAEHCIVSC